MNKQEMYNVLMQDEWTKNANIKECLNNVSVLTDISRELNKIEGTRRSITILETILENIVDPIKRTTALYFISIAWGDVLEMAVGQDVQKYTWEQEENQKIIYYLRSAILDEGFGEIENIRKCQIFTNLANSFRQVGRYVEAIEYYDQALLIISDFGHAIGNKGLTLKNYARYLYDGDHQRLFLKKTYDNLAKSVKCPHTNPYFVKEKDFLETKLSKEIIDLQFDMNAFPLGDDDQEKEYRKWCLVNRLFLNPLNDLGYNTVAATDVISVPNMVVKLGEAPYYAGFYSQMKQEYVAARYLFYEGKKSNKPHFADKEVAVVNTLDYAEYSLSVEKMKIAYRMLYSIFDKIAFFINHYLGLGINDRCVYFNNLWYKGGDYKKGVKEIFENNDNMPLRGLFWLSKDLREDTNAIEPEARNLRNIRHYLEHRYFKTHWGCYQPPTKEVKASMYMNDDLSYSIGHNDFEDKTVKLMKTVRAALIYLSAAISVEENYRTKKRDSNSILPGIPLTHIKDDWKI